MKQATVVCSQGSTMIPYDGSESGLWEDADAAPKRKVVLNRLIDDEAERKRLEKEFTKAEAWLYGKHQDVGYLSLDLLWGQGLYQKLRFALVVNQTFNSQVRFMEQRYSFLVLL